MLGFLHVQLPPLELLLIWASFVLVFHLTGAELRFFLARLNLSHGTIDVRGACHFLCSVSLQQKFETTDEPVLQLSFIWQAKKNTSSRHEGGRTEIRKMKRSSSSIFAPLFIYIYIYFFFPPPAEPAVCKLD